MSIEKFIKTVCVQDAVYWGSPAPDGYGGIVWGNPEQIKVRWEDKFQEITDATGIELISKAEVLVTEDLDYGGMLMLGVLNDLESGATPEDLNNAYQIKAVTKVPMIKSTTDFVRKVYLSAARI